MCTAEKFLTSPNSNTSSTNPFENDSLRHPTHPLPARQKINKSYDVGEQIESINFKYDTKFVKFFKMNNNIYYIYTLVNDWVVFKIILTVIEMLFL